MLDPKDFPRSEEKILELEEAFEALGKLIAATLSTLSEEFEAKLSK